MPGNLLIDELASNEQHIVASQPSLNFFSNSTPSVGKNGLFKVKVDFYLTAIFFFLGLKNSNEVIWLGCQVINQVVIQFRWNTNWVSRFFPHFSTQSRDWSWRSAAGEIFTKRLDKVERYLFQLFFLVAWNCATAAGSIIEKMRFLAKKNARFSAPHMWIFFTH